MSITLSTNNTQVRKLTPKDEDFCINSGYTYYPRATIAISNDCPERYRSMIVTAISRGWLSSEAWVKDSEYMWEKLTDGQ